jgi:acetolactate synthase-1/2/3 large subunit
MTIDLAGTGASALARALKQLGVRRVFGLCSDQTNSVFCALATEEIDIIGTRHETGAIHMAEGWARATGEPCVAVIGGGPGFVNGVAGIAVAQAAAVPVVVIAGQPPLHTRDRNGHQIVYQADIVRSLTKWSQEVTSPDIVAEFVARGFHIATSGKPGPVCLSIPTNVLEGALSAAATPYKVLPMQHNVNAPPGTAPGATSAVDLLNQSVRPVIIIGATAWGGIASGALAGLVRRLGIPAFTFEVARGLIPDDGVNCFGYAHPQYNKTFHEIKAADLLLLVGAEVWLHTGANKRKLLGPDARIIQIHTDYEQIGIGRPSDAVIIGSLEVGLESLAGGLSAAARERQHPWLEHVRCKYAGQRAAWKSLHEKLCAGNPAIHPLAVHTSLARHYSDRIRLSIDGGDFANWARVFFQAKTPGYWLDKTEMGNIGVSLPVGIGAQIARPAYQTWVLMGDGGFGFNGMELSTAVELKLPVKVIIGNDRCWGVERRLQLAHYGRTVATDLPDVRYHEIARAMGAQGLYVDDPAKLDAAVDELLSSEGPALLNVRMQRDAGRLSDERTSQEKPQ